MSSFREYLLESKSITTNIDWVGESSLASKLSKKYKIKIKVMHNGTADVTGDPKKIIKFLTGDYDMDIESVQEVFPELF